MSTTEISKEQTVPAKNETSQNLLIKAHTEMTFQNVKDFNHKIRKPQRIATLASSIAFAVFGIYTATLPVKNISTIVLFLVLAVFFFFLYLACCGIFDTEKQFRQKTYFSGTGQDFFFYETAFVVLLSNGSATQTQVNYSQLEKVEENESYFYLYPQKNFAYLIDKNTFEEGSPNDLRELLQKYIPTEKYISSL